MMLSYSVEPLGVWDKVDRKTVRCPFDITEAKTERELMRELAHVGATDVTLHLDVRAKDIRIDGRLRLGSAPRSHRVRVSWRNKRGEESVSECATYPRAWDNIRAIGLRLTLDRLRAVSRYGAVSLEELHRGFSALPPGTGEITRGGGSSNNTFAKAEHAAEWLIVVGMTELVVGKPGPRSSDVIADPSVLREVKRAASKVLHPDAGGDAAEFAKIAEACELIAGTAGGG